MLRCVIPIFLNCAVAIFLLPVPQPCVARARDAVQKPEGKPAADKQVGKPTTVEAAENPAQIELLETRVRFESNGDSRKEVHARVKINNELGARQFARLNFDYNRNFEQVEIPLVRITHPSGGTSDILPSAITDIPNPAVANAPAYQDVRIQSVRILGLGTGDSLEYRVITTVSHRPLAPDFWLDHSFDRTGVVSHETLELDLPASRQVQLRINPATPATSVSGDVGGIIIRMIYRWDRSASAKNETAKESSLIEPDIVLTTFTSWQQLADRLGTLLKPKGQPAPEIFAKASELVHELKNPDAMMMAIYDFVSQKIKTIDLPLGTTGFQTRPASEILSTGYGTPEDKHALFAALGNSFFGPARAGLVSASSPNPQSSLPRPSVFDHFLTVSGYPSINSWMDLNIEVAPYCVIPSQFRGKHALLVGPAVDDIWPEVLEVLPFPSLQSVSVDATLAADGTLSAKVKYIMRGDIELLLRVAFHRTPKEKWRDVAQLLSISDGFRGQIANANASDPYATKEPFKVEYEISQPRFVDWSKKPVRIPAILPLVGLPDPPAKTAPGATPSPIDLGTPLNIEAHVTLHLPAGTTATAPTGTSVERDYATFSSSYSAKAATISASRHLHFLLREIPAARAADYNAFRRAVQNDETQEFTIERAETASPKTNSAAPGKPAPPKPNAQKP